MSDDYEIDTAVAVDNRLFPRIYKSSKSSKKDSDVIVRNDGPNSIYIWQYRDKYPINQLLLRIHESHLFEKSSFFKQLFFMLETPGANSIIHIGIDDTDKK